MDHKISFKLPRFREGENAVIGACLFSEDAIPRVVNELSSTDFTQDRTRKLYEAIRELYTKREPVDHLTVTRWCQKHGVLEAVGGVETIIDIADAVPSSGNVMHYARLVKEASSRRKVIYACREALTSAVDEDQDLSAVIGELEQQCFEVLNTRRQSGPRKFADITAQYTTDLEARAGEGRSRGVRSGLMRLDNQTGGFRAGELIICCARPSMGKSALALDIALNVCKTGPVVFFSLEMSTGDLWDRITSKGSNVSLWRLRKGQLGDEHWSAITQAVGEQEDLRLWLDDTPSLSPVEIYSRTQNVCLQNDIHPALIVVDYLQIMKPDKDLKNREREVASMSAAMKVLAKNMKCPVLLLSQMNREVTRRAIRDQMPRLSDLRESGAIEQDADVVLGLWRRGALEQTPENEHHAELGILKQRNGPIGQHELYWIPETATFKDKSLGEAWANRTPYRDEDHASMSEV